jgi:hypothetical protein
VDAKDMIPVTDLNVKSVIATPTDWAKPGDILVQGVAWSNTSPVTKVELSFDGGRNWEPTKLGGRPTKYGFRKWSYAWKPPEGPHVLMSRATNAAGESQPLEPEWNPNGYLYNAAQPRRIVISKTRVANDVSTPEPPPAPAVYKIACFSCHDEHMMQQQHLTLPQWDREVTKMTNWGAPVKAEQRGELLQYLAARFRL